jgi:hypothetical protein
MSSADNLLIQQQHGADWHFPFVFGPARLHEGLPHPEFRCRSIHKTHMEKAAKAIIAVSASKGCSSASISNSWLVGADCSKIHP